MGANFGGVIYRGKLQVYPLGGAAQQEVKFGGNFCWEEESWRAEVGNLAVVAYVSRTTTKKPRQNPGYAYVFS